MKDPNFQTLSQEMIFWVCLRWLDSSSWPQWPPSPAFFSPGLQDRFPQDYSGPAAPPSDPLLQIHQRSQEPSGRGLGERWRLWSEKGSDTPPTTSLWHGQRVGILGVLLQVVSVPYVPQVQVQDRTLDTPERGILLWQEVRRDWYSFFFCCIFKREEGQAPPQESQQ